MNSLQNTFNHQGTLLFEKNDLPMHESQWQALRSLVENVDYELVVGGDAGEGHSVKVCRFYNDVEKPTALHEQSSLVESIVMSEEMRRFYSRFIGTDKLCLRRCQANLLNEGDYIGIHSDQDSNPDYVATVVFHFDEDYQGGEFVTHDDSHSQSFRPGANMVLVNNCFIPHEVTPVTKGVRRTLACFLSKNFGPSPTRRQNFKVVKSD